MHWSRAAAVGSSVWAREPPATSILAGGRGWGASEKAKQAAAADRRVPPASASRRNLRCMPGLLWPRQRAEDLRALSVREEGAAAPRRAPEGASRTRDDVAAIAGMQVPSLRGELFDSWESRWNGGKEEKLSLRKKYLHSLRT